MKLMRRLRDGKLMVFDPELVKTSRYEEVFEDKPKRKTYKEALSAKARELGGLPNGDQMDSKGNQKAGVIA